MNKLYSYYDKFDRLLFGFILIFIITLTNSIFLNQIGYFGALFILLIQWYKSKENKFFRTGLELPFLLFLSIELISALFSYNQSQALTIFLKRLALIPVIYVTASAAYNLDKAKLFFKVFIIAAVLTVIAYLFIAYRHYIFQLYRLESRGPSVFQYVMTAGGLMSFVTVILFAFVINEKRKWKINILILSAFLITTVGLISSYTRAAWIGSIAGIVFILILKRKWIFLAPLIVALILLVVLSKKESKIWIYSIDNNPQLINSFSTTGKAVNLELHNKLLYLTDYEEGVKVIDSTGNILQKIDTEAPATHIHLWKEKYLVIYLIDSRFKVAEILSDGKLKIISSSITVGLTRDLEVYNNNFYTVDYDSGLTVYQNPLELSDKLRVIDEEGFVKVFSDSSYLALYNSKDNFLKVYRRKENTPAILIDTIKIITPTYYLWKDDQFIFFQTDKSLLQYEITTNKVKYVNGYDIHGIFSTIKADSITYCSTVDGKFYKTRKDDNGMLHFELMLDLQKNVTDFSVHQNKLIISTLKLNRLTSIVDPYHETNIERLHLWRTGIKIFFDHPLIGVGDIDLGDIYSIYKPKYVKENYGHLHNNYLHFLVILGGIGFIIVVFMLYKIFALNYKIYQTLKESEFVSSYSLGTLGAFVGFLISGLAEWNFGDQEIITMVWFTIGLNIAFYKMYLKNKVDS